MKPRDIARAITNAGWLAGMVLILAGLPTWCPLTAFAAIAGTAAVWARWGADLWLGLRAGVNLRRLIGRAAKTGGTLERV